MSQKLFEEKIEFSGHPNIRGTHRNTIEVTKVPEISIRADCIIGVKANAACNDLSEQMKRHIRSGGRLLFELRVDRDVFTFFGRGIKDLPLTNREELVIRRSQFQSDRTAAGNCEAAALDVPRAMISKLRSPETKGFLIISAMNDIDYFPVMGPTLLES